MNTQAYRIPGWLSLLAAILVSLSIAHSVVLYRLYRAERPAPAPAQQARDATPFVPPAPRPLSWFDDRADPFAEFERMREYMDRMFDEAIHRFNRVPGIPRASHETNFLPDLDLQEDGDRFIVRMDIPGAEKSNIKVAVEGQMLTVSGSTEETVERNDGQRILRSERRVGRFERSVLLPGPVQQDKLEAKYEQGVLVVTVPKAETAPARRSVPVA